LFHKLTNVGDSFTFTTNHWQSAQYSYKHAVPMM